MLTPLEAVTLGVIIGTALGTGWLIGTIQDNTPSAIPAITVGDDIYGPNGACYNWAYHWGDGSKTEHYQLNPNREDCDYSCNLPNICSDDSQCRIHAEMICGCCKAKGMAP